MIKHPIEWFEAQIPKTIVRVRINDDGEGIPSYVQVKDKNYAEQYFCTQSDEMYYKENSTASREKKNDPIDDMKPIIRIHRSGLADSCIARES